MFRAKIVHVFILAGFLLLRSAIGLASPKVGQSGTDRTDYVGDVSCQKCHRDVAQNYQHTPHHLTSQLPTTDSVHGSFQNGTNSLVIVDSAQSAEPGLQFQMDAKK